MPDNIYEVVSQAARYWFLFLMALIAWRSYRWLRRDRRQQKKRLSAEKELLEREKENIIARQALTDAEIRSVQVENLYLQNEVENKRRDLINYAMSIVEQKEYFEKVSGSLRELLSEKRNEIKDEKLKKVEWDGETYLINTSGKIQKNKKNAKNKS